MFRVHEGKLQFGNAHYSRSNDDGRRLNYPLKNGKLTYEHDVPGLNHEATKEAADALVEKINQILA